MKKVELILAVCLSACSQPNELDCENQISAVVKGVTAAVPDTNSYSYRILHCMMDINVDSAYYDSAGKIIAYKCAVESAMFRGYMLVDVDTSTGALEATMHAYSLVELLSDKDCGISSPGFRIESYVNGASIFMYNTFESRAYLMSNGELETLYTPFERRLRPEATERTTCSCGPPTGPS